MSADFQSLEKRLWFIACPLVALLYLLSVPRIWQCEGLDEIEYLALAQSLLKDFGYTIFGEPHVLYPPLYPILLAAIMKIAGATAWPALYAANALAGLAGVFIFCQWMRNRFGAEGRWAGWFTLVSYYMWSFSTRFLLSESLFLLLSAVAIVAADRRRHLVVVIAVLLAAMTRFGALALVAALGAALFIHALRSRRAQTWITLILVVGLGRGFWAYWDYRASSLSPNAVESYGKWIHALLGTGDADTAKLAERVGEGLAEKTGAAQRLLLLGVKTGQYATGAVRISPGFYPLGLIIFALILAGAAGHARREPDSAAAWYVAISLLMITATSWVSSYTRYLYPLTPLLFLFLFLGLRTWAEQLQKKWVRVLCVLAGMAGVAWIVITPWPPMGEREAVYAAAWSVAALMACFSLALVSFAGRFRNFRSAFLVAVAANTLLMATLRFNQTMQLATPRQRNMTGLMESCAWIGKNAPAEAPIYSSFPRLVSVMSGRVARQPGTNDLAQGAGYVVLSGPLREMPAYREDAESELREAVAGWPDVFASGEAAVYKSSETRD